MKRSIRSKFAWIFLFFLTGILVICMLANVLFFKRFYIVSKKHDINSIYKLLDDASFSNSLQNEEFLDKLSAVCDVSEISVFIETADGSFISVPDDLNSFSELKNKIYEDMNDPSYIFSNDDISIKSRVVMGHEIMELFGELKNGEKFFIVCTIDNIKESTAIANRFMLYSGLIVLAFGLLITIIITNFISKPICKITEISSRMVNLDFDARYEDNGIIELDELGDNINTLSEKLEKTISELKCANNSLRNDIRQKDEIENMRKEFLSNVSHELKTPIALIQSYSEGLKEGISEDKESQDYYLNVIIDEAGKMNALVKELTSLSELEFGNKMSDIERFNIVELINNKITSNDIFFKQNDIKVEFTKFDDSIFVWSDEFRIEEVISNYLSNAIHYCMGEKIIRISIDKLEDEKIRINVFNTGNNINENDIQHIWEKFYKADKARSRDYGGSGIGLSIVKAIMEKLDMQYGVKNEPDGVTFYFELPT